MLHILDMQCNSMHVHSEVRIYIESGATRFVISFQTVVHESMDNKSDSLFCKFNSNLTCHSHACTTLRMNSLMSIYVDISNFS